MSDRMTASQLAGLEAHSPGADTIEHVEDAEFTPVIHEPQEQAGGSLTLFHTDDPVEVIARASATATALAGVIKKQKLATVISGREHVRVEGWTLLGSMLGVFPVVVWTKPVERDGVQIGWEARVEARTRDGAVVGAAEAECLATEKTWGGRDDYARKSMAQTRATSKAMRGPLGFVMTLAGFDATPMEEMPREDTSRASQSAPKPQPATKKTAEPTDEAKPTGEPRKASDRQIVMLHVQLGKCYDRELFTEAAYRAQLKKDYGVESSKQLTARDCSQLIDRLAIVLDEPKSPA